MGMFDTIVFVGAALDVIAPRCAAGHLLTNFQTKDFDCEMVTYYVYDRFLYRIQGQTVSSRGNYEERFVPVKTGAVLSYTAPFERANLEPPTALKIISEKIADPYEKTPSSAAVYTHCGACLPILIERDNDWERIAEIVPWCEFELIFNKSMFVSYNTLKAESRDDLKAKYPNHIPDTDRVAVRHFERRKP